MMSPASDEERIWYGQRLIRAGGGLRFVVFDPVTGNRSSTWMVKTAKPSPEGQWPRDDIYLWEVTTGGQFKVSHHLGRWRIAMTKEHATALGEERLVFDSQDPPVPDEGWSEGVAVLVPCAYLRRSTVPLKRSVRQIPISNSHSAVVVSLLFEDSGSTVMRQIPGAFPVGVLARAEGGNVWVIAEPVSLGATEHESLAWMCGHARESFPPSSGPGRFVGIFTAEERRFLADLCVS